MKGFSLPIPTPHNFVRLLQTHGGALIEYFMQPDLTQPPRPAFPISGKHQSRHDSGVVTTQGTLRKGLEKLRKDLPSSPRPIEDQPAIDKFIISTKWS